MYYECSRMVVALCCDDLPTSGANGLGTSKTLYTSDVCGQWRLRRKRSKGPGVVTQVEVFQAMP